jgi:hypothetical protein
MNKPTTQDVYDAINIILSDTAKYETSLNYAILYCKAVIGYKMEGKLLEVQCLYILNNITGWRHPQAKEVRATLKSFAKTIRS